MLFKDPKQPEAKHAVAKKHDETEGQRIRRMIHEAKRFAGDADDDMTPLSEEEGRIMAEIRAQHRRPTRDEIKEMARRLAARSKQS